MNSGINQLHAYPFEQLKILLADTKPTNLPPIKLSVGEPQHPPPTAALQSIIENVSQFGKYPLTRGKKLLREVCLEWLCKRFDLDPTTLDADRHILPLNGTREGLFAIGQSLINRNNHPIVIMPNPLYQIYEGSTLLAGAEPYYLNCLENNKFLPDFDITPDEIWHRCQLVYLCTPDNPSGAVLPQTVLQNLIGLAHRFDFSIVADECYSEIYYDEAAPPRGLLAASQAMSNAKYARCLAFYSLSKRSNLPGLRSGFVAGDAQLLAQFLRYRIYHGCSMPPPLQQASISAWRDEQHVIENRSLYREKMQRFIEIIGDRIPLRMPAAGFYLWPDIGTNSEQFTRLLYKQQNLEVLPGMYLSRQVNGINPGINRIRIALVAEYKTCEQAAHRLHDFLDDFSANTNE